MDQNSLLERVKDAISRGSYAASRFHGSELDLATEELEHLCEEVRASTTLQAETLLAIRASVEDYRRLLKFLEESLYNALHAGEPKTMVYRGSGRMMTGGNSLLRRVA